MSAYPPRPPPPPAPPPRRSSPVRLPPPPSRPSAPAGPSIEEPTARFSRPTIVLAVSGSIAAYKAAEIARLLIKGGARVIPVMTRAAKEFLGPITLSGLTGERVRDDMFDAATPGELHVELAREADVILFAPATADLLARLASGRADDLLCALYLCTKAPVIAAPAMHPRMWDHPATQRNVGTLADDGRMQLVGPVHGEVASGESGMGRMASPEMIAAAALARATKPDLAGLRIVVTAGPTLEDIDPVRFVGNRSTGKMGFAVAERAAARGAEVTLIAGPVTLPTPYHVRRVDVRSAIAMRSALWQALGPELSGADALIMSAAVGDYRPAEEHAAKIKRVADSMTLEMVPNPDILAEIGIARAESHPVLVGFAVETDTDERVVASARTKLEAKRVDLVVANHASDSFGRDDNRATLVTRAGADPLPVMAKTELSDRILDRVAALCRP